MKTNSDTTRPLWAALISPPCLDDDDARRQASMAHRVVWVLMLTVTPVVLVMMFLRPENTLRSVTLIALIDGLGIAWLLLLRKGFVRTVSWLLVAQLWAVVTARAWTEGGVASMPAVFFVVVVAVAGMLLGPRAGVVTVLLCAASEFGLVLAHQAGFLPTSVVQETHVTLWFTHLLLLLMVAGLQHLALVAVRRSLVQARDELELRRQAEAELRRHHDQLEVMVAQRTADLHKLSVAVENSSSSIMITDAEGAIEYVNPAFCHTTGYSAEELHGENPRILKGGDQPDSMYENLWNTILAGERWRGEFQNRTKSGDLVWDISSIAPIRGDDGEISNFVAVKEDITELKKLQEQLTRQAYYDKLTALPNRALFFDRLQQVHALSRRKERTFALMFIDLDGFKAVNDTFGHDVGDALLVEVAARLNGCVRASDTVARMGGDEFTILLTDQQHAEEPSLVARRVLEVLAEPVQVEGATCQIGACIGISVFPDHGDDPDALLARADEAMYEVKRSGKNNFRFAETAA